MLPETPLLYTFERTAEILGVSARTVRRLAKRGELGTISMRAGDGRGTERVPRQAIISFVTPSNTDTTDASDS